jgi:polyhydroxybutyrate depolymerase
MGKVAGAALIGAALVTGCASPEGAAPVRHAPAAVERPPAAAATYLPPGVHQHQVQVDEHTRRWTTVVPEGGSPGSVLVVLHGVGGRGVDMRSTGFERPGVAVAYPDGLGGAWNDGRPGADPIVPGVDDIRFLRLVIEETTARTGVDRKRVAVVGFSNGAVMAGRLACELTDGVAAVALVGGAGGHGFEQSCRPSRPVAVMLVAGANDRLVPYGGGRVADWGTRRRGFVAPVEDAFAFWRASAGCSSTEVVAGTGQVSVARGAGCRAGTTVVRYRVSGGHEWFRAPTFDTTAAVWEFVNRRFSTIA